jgi:hypothetical protein
MEQMSFDDALLKAGDASVTLGEMTKLAEEIRIAQNEKIEAEARVTSISTKLEEMKRNFILSLENAGLTSMKVPEVGNFIVTNRYQVSMPKDQESREKFFAYLKERGIYDNMITVNSQTLNSFYKTTMEEAMEAGDVDFKIEGLSEPTLTKTLQVRKA